MLDEKETSQNISRFFSQFEDKKLEEVFLEQEIRKPLNYLRSVVLFLGFLFFLFIIPDYFIITDTSIFLSIFVMRSFFLLLVYIFYLLLRMKIKYRILLRWICLLKVVAALFFLIVFFIYESPSFFIQSFAVVLMIMAFYLITNRWLNVALISTALAAGYIFTAYNQIKGLETVELAAVSVFLFLIIFMNCLSSYRLNYIKRMEFLYNRKLKKASEIDGLTGIYVKAKFNRKMEECMKIAGRYGHPLSLILFDVDDFKLINDRCGHVKGERVLAALAQLVKGVIRQTDIFARWGGDEFAILSPHTSESSAYELAERIRLKIASKDFDLDGSVTCSFGVAGYEKDDDIDSFLARADKKLYQAKQSGKNLVE